MTDRQPYKLICLNLNTSFIVLHYYLRIYIIRQIYVLANRQSRTRMRQTKRKRQKRKQESIYLSKIACIMIFYNFLHFCDDFGIKGKPGYWLTGWRIKFCLDIMVNCNCSTHYIIALMFHTDNQFHCNWKLKLRAAVWWAFIQCGKKPMLKIQTKPFRYNKTFTFTMQKLN